MKKRKEIYGDYSTFCQIKPEIVGNIIVGIIEIPKPAKAIKGTDYFTTFKTIDMEGTIACIRCFSSEENFIYKNFRRGNVVKILDLKKYNISNNKIYLMNRDNKIELVYRIEGGQAAIDISTIEQEIINKVLKKLQPILCCKGGKEMKIEDLTQNIFFDFRGKLIEKVEEENSYILFFIDGTKNKQVDSSEFIFNFPANMVLFVKIWRKDCGEILKVNRFYLLKNLHTTRMISRIESNFSEKNNFYNIMEQTCIGNFTNELLDGVFESHRRNSFKYFQLGLNYMTVIFYGRTPLSEYNICMTHKKIKDLTCITPCNLLEVQLGNIAVGDLENFIICTYKEPLISKIDILVYECQYPILFYKNEEKYFIVDIFGN